jgi:hypothetical protein
MLGFPDIYGGFSTSMWVYQRGTNLDDVKTWVFSNKLLQPCFFVAVLMMVDNCFFWGSPIINPKPLYFGWTRGKQDCSSWFFLAKDCHFWAENTWDFVSLLKTFLWKLRITHQSAESSTWYIVCWGATGETGGPTATSKFCFRDR